MATATDTRPDTAEKIDDLSELTVEALEAVVGDDPDKAKTAFKAERANKDRITVRRHLARVIGRATTEDHLPQWVLTGQVVDDKARYQIGGKNVDLFTEHGNADLISDFDFRTTGARRDFAGDEAQRLSDLADAFYDAAANTESITDLRDLASMAYMTELTAKVAAELPDPDTVGAVETITPPADDDQTDDQTDDE